MTEHRTTDASVLVRAASGGHHPPVESQPAPLSHQPLPAEAEFYQPYAWTLNAYPTIAEVMGHLRDEIGRIDSAPRGWQLAEVATNVFLLACALGNAVDDHLMGKGYDFSKAGAVPPVRPALRLAESALKLRRRIRESRMRWLIGWRDGWEAAVTAYAEVFVPAGPPDQQALTRGGRRLSSMLTAGLPGALVRGRLKNPAFFHVRDLTHVDMLTLGGKLVARFPDRRTPVLITGIRTAGSYFAPLLRAYLNNEGYQSVDVVTLRVKNGLSVWEGSRIARAAQRDAVGVIAGDGLTVCRTLRYNSVNQIC